MEEVTTNLISEERFNELFSSDKVEDVEELKKHIVIANNISEWIELNRQIREKYKLEDANWDALAHENAHVAIAIQNGFKFENYFIAFLKSKTTMFNMKPICRINASLDSVENITNFIEMLEAPEKFGDSNVSKGDIEFRDNLLLKKSELEKRDKGKLAKLRKFLGI